MKRRDSRGLADEGEEPQDRTWGERFSQWFRRSMGIERAVSERPPLETGFRSLPLSARELDALKASYLRRLSERFRSLHLYGLDAYRRSLQETGQALDLQAIYTPLNATLQTPTLSVPTSARASALEAVGRERRAIVRGPHGSGKSTLLRFLALSLAREPSGSECPGLACLGPAWTHGWLFPVWIDLRAFAASPHAGRGADGLCDYLAADLGIYPDQLRDQLILPGGMLFLLDGLEMALKAVADFLARFEHTPNQFIVSSQEYVDLGDSGQAASERALPLRGLAEIALAPWTFDEMDVFVQQWYAELERKAWVDVEAARDLPGQLRSCLRRDEVVALARRPSLMTLIALLHTLHGRLPPSRVTFYHNLIDLSFISWSEGRGERERDLRQAFDVDDLRTAVAQATFSKYTHLENPTDLVELPASELRAILINVCRDRRLEAVDTLVTRMLTRPSLLDESRNGVYVYAHPSLQAHVAAYRLAMQPDLPRLAVSLAQEDFARWREIILLAGVRLVRLEGDLPAALAVIDALCRRPSPTGQGGRVSDAEWRMAWLAGEMLVEIGEPEAGNLPHALKRVKGWLATLLAEGRLDPLERTKVGRALDRLPNGDPRPGVSSTPSVWCAVPSGAFWQGEGESANMVDVAAFWMARYLVTNAQYAVFVQATGHAPPTHWQGDRPPVGMGNHPVTNVTWQDASQYCAWCTERVFSEQFQVWRSGRVEVLDRAPDRVTRAWTVRLPTSTEWEKAARGGLQIPASGSDALVDNPLPRRIYPWGDGWRLSVRNVKGDEMRCNVSESNIGATTPVGMYPEGASPYGLMDMAGNVWEWCLDWAGEQNRYKIRRGGAFRYTHEHARCAAYDKAHPDLGWPYLGFRAVLAPPEARRRLG